MVHPIQLQSTGGRIAACGGKNADRWAKRRWEKRRWAKRQWAKRRARDRQQGMIRSHATTGDISHAWIALPLGRRTQQDPDRFRTNLKTHLFNVASS